MVCRHGFGILLYPNQERSEKDQKPFVFTRKAILYKYSLSGGYVTSALCHNRIRWDLGCLDTLHDILLITRMSKKWLACWGIGRTHALQGMGVKAGDNWGNFHCCKVFRDPVGSRASEDISSERQIAATRKKKTKFLVRSFDLWWQHIPHLGTCSSPFLGTWEAPCFEWGLEQEVRAAVQAALGWDHMIWQTQCRWRCQWWETRQCGI